MYQRLPFCQRQNPDLRQPGQMICCRRIVTHCWTAQPPAFIAVERNSAVDWRERIGTTSPVTMVYLSGAGVTDARSPAVDS